MSEETEVKKNIEWLKEAVLELQSNGNPETNQTEAEKEMGRLQKWAWDNCVDRVYELINQLDEPEVLSQEWIDEHHYIRMDPDNPFVYVKDLQNLLVPKQEDVDRAYKDGYEKGKEYTFYKGYLEGLADKESEPETVADVVTTFWKSYERLKKVMNMEVEELEE